MNLQVELVEQNNTQHFKIVGEIDAFTAPILRERLDTVEKTEGMNVELDLSDVGYMDSTGLGVFVGFYKTIKANEGQMKIIGASSRLKRLFEITGLDGIMDIVTEESGDVDATV